MSQADAPTARWAAVGGVPLLTFLVALAGATLAWLILRRASGGSGPRVLRPGTADAGHPRTARWPRWIAGPAVATVAASGLAAAGAALPVDPVAGGAISGSSPRCRGTCRTRVTCRSC